MSKNVLVIINLVSHQRRLKAGCKDSREQFRPITIEGSRLSVDRVTQSFDHD